MINKEDYLKAKDIVDSYEKQEFEKGCDDAMYCSSCQALEQHDCLCEELDDDETCEYCSNINGRHVMGCPYDNDPYHFLLQYGYD